MSAEASGDAWRSSPYRGDLFLVHLAVADVANDVHEYRFWMHRSSLAAKARVSRSTVDRALRTFVADGWLTVLTRGGGRGKPTEYRYNLGGVPPVEQPRLSDAVSEGDTASSGADTASSWGEPSSLSTQETQDAPPAASAAPSTTAWRLARARLAAGMIVDRGPQNLARAVQAALDVPYTPEIVERALDSIRGVPIAAGNLTVECSRLLAAETADRTDEPTHQRRWWEHDDDGAESAENGSRW